jgi:hypothetical protein
MSKTRIKLLIGYWLYKERKCIFLAKNISLVEKYTRMKPLTHFFRTRIEFVLGIIKCAQDPINHVINFRFNVYFIIIFTV